MNKLQFFKIIISVSLICVLIYSVELDDLLVQLNSMNIWLLFIAFAFLVVQFPVSTIKWGTALDIHGIRFPFIYLQKVLCIGFFFNNFLPSSIGGDGYRVYKTMPDEGYRSRSLSAVLLERIGGLAVLLIIGLVGGIITLFEMQSAIVVHYVAIAAIVIVSLFFTIIFYRLCFFARIINKIKKIKKLDIVIHNLGHIRRNTAKLKLLVFQSLIFQLMAVAVIYILFYSLGIEAGWSKYAFIAAMVGVASVIPLSINGIGIVEGAFVVTAVQLGIDYNQAVIVAVTMRLFVIPLSVVCGLIYLLDARNA